MTRQEIKDIVYNCAKNQCYDDDFWLSTILSKSNDGEDVLIYDELMFDSLDITEMIMNIEYELKNKNYELLIPYNVITKDITFGILIDYIYKQTNKENG